MRCRLSPTATCRRTRPGAATGRYCCKSRKSNDAENLAKADFSTPPLLQGSVAPMRRSVVSLVRNNEVPHIATYDTEFLSAQLDRLRRRSRYLDWAVVFATIGGAATCSAAAGVFLGTLLEQEFKVAVFGFFGTALLCTIISLGLFAIEMLMAGHGLRGVVVRQQQKTADKSQPNT